MARNFDFSFSFIRPAIVAATVLMGTLSAAPALAATVLNTGGPQNGIAAMAPNTSTQATALVFEVTGDLTNAALSFELDCVISCSGNIFLTKRNVLQGITISSLLDVAVYTGKGVQNAFSGLDLSAGIYSLVVDIQSGFAGWLGSQQPAPSGDGRAAILGAGLSGVSNPAFPPGSAWTALTTYTPGLLFTADPAGGGPAPVPLPAAGLMLGAALAALALRRRRKTA